MYKAVQYGIKSEVQYEIKSGAAADELATVTISRKDLSSVEWLEEGKEMRYNNQLYDIVKTKETAAEITFYCINDSKEKSLLSGLEEHINTNVTDSKPINNSPAKKLNDNLHKLYFSNETSYKFNNVSKISTHFFTSSLIYSSAFIDTSSHPPEFV